MKGKLMLTLFFRLILQFYSLILMYLCAKQIWDRKRDEIWLDLAGLILNLGRHVLR